MDLRVDKLSGLCHQTLNPNPPKLQASSDSSDSSSSDDSSDSS